MAKRTAARERARPLIRLGVALFYTARQTLVLSPDTAVCYTVASLVVPFQLPFRSPLVPRKDMRFVLQYQLAMYGCLSSAELKRKRTFRQGCTEQLRCP